MASGRFGDMIVIYFTMGVVMWGSGLLSFDEAAPLSLVFKGPNFAVKIGQMSGIFGPLNYFLGAPLSILIAVLDFVQSVISFVNWPVVVMLQLNAPPRAVAIVGGIPTAMFYVSAVAFYRSVD